MADTGIDKRTVSAVVDDMFKGLIEAMLMPETRVLEISGFGKLYFRENRVPFYTSDLLKRVGKLRASGNPDKIAEANKILKNLKVLLRKTPYNLELIENVNNLYYE